MKSEFTKVNPKPNTVKPIVQGIEQLQRLRIQTGNRIAAIHRLRTSGDVTEIGTMTPDEQQKTEKEFNSTLDSIRKDYTRITDEVVAANYKKAKVSGYLPTPTKFQPTTLINSYSELLLVDQYLRHLENEEINIGQLEQALSEYPIYTNYLKTIPGIGPKIAGVIISEIDIYQTKYVKSAWVYAGLDTVIYGEYEDDNGKKHQLSQAELTAFYKENGSNAEITVNGHPVVFKTKGRDRSRVSLVQRPYRTASGEEALRNSISFNAYLKTKLIGVLGGSFLKQASTTVDGERMGTAAREGLASTLGWKPTKGASATVKKAEVIRFLRENGYVVETSIGRFAKIYYDYRGRIEKSVKPSHQGLTPAHIHNMAIRYMIKMFLRELYIVWRHLENLPIYKDYASAKLGYTHDSNVELYRQWGIDPNSLLDPEYLAEEEGQPEQIARYIKERNVPVGIINQ